MTIVDSSRISVIVMKYINAVLLYWLVLSAIIVVYGVVLKSSYALANGSMIGYPPIILSLAIYLIVAILLAGNLFRDAIWRNHYADNFSLSLIGFNFFYINWERDLLPILLISSIGLVVATYFYKMKFWNSRYFPISIILFLLILGRTSLELQIGVYFVIFIGISTLWYSFLYQHRHRKLDNK